MGVHQRKEQDDDATAQEAHYQKKGGEGSTDGSQDEGDAVAENHENKDTQDA